MNVRVGTTTSGPIGGLGRHMAWTYVQLASSAIAGLLITAIALRRLGAAHFGVFALVTAISSYFLLFDLGLSFVVVRAAARDLASRDDRERAEARTETETAHSAYACVGAVTLVATVVFVLASPAVLPPSPAGKGAQALTAGLVGLSVAVALGTSALPGILKGRNCFRLLAMATVAGSTVDLVIVLGLIEWMGLVALGLGSFGAVLANRVIVAWTLRRQVPWFHLWPRRPTVTQLRKTFHIVLPLLLLTIGGQVISTSDLVVLGVLASGTVVGLYSLGSSLPTQAIGILYQGYDVVLPAFSASTDPAEQENTLRFLTRVASYIGGVGLGLMALLRDDIILLIAGEPSALASSVLLVFCGIWMITIGPHGLILLLIARTRERALMPFVVAEMMMNIGLTVVLIHIVGPIGAAYATLATLIMASLVFLPVIARRELELPVWSLLIVHGLLPLGAGVAIAVSSWGAMRWMAVSPMRIMVVGTLGVLSGAVVGLSLLGRNGRKQLEAVLRRQPVSSDPS